MITPSRGIRSSEIEIAREFDHPPTALERVAYAVEQNDHRGTFYFAQLATAAPKGSKGLVGFHGAGGGGSMMSMDAIVNAGFTIANFTDTSGNPSASKVYRARESFSPNPIWWVISVPAPGLRARNNLVRVRFGEGVLGTRSRYSCGDSSRRQHRRSRCGDLASHVEALACAGRRLPQNRHTRVHRRAFCRTGRRRSGKKWKPRTPRVPKFVKDPSATKLAVKNGRVWIDTARWPEIRAAVETHSGGLIIDRDGAPVAALPNEEFATKDSELLACDVECRLAGIEGFYLELEIPGLDELIGGGR